MWEILLTDALLYLLLAALAVYVVVAARAPQLRLAWRRVFARPIGAATVVVLLAFVAVALLDSIHYRPAVQTPEGEFLRYAPRVITVFDALTTALHNEGEKTYSAPFAAYLYVKQMVPGPDGEEIYRYPRLKYGGAHLEELDQRLDDIVARAVVGAAWGLLAAALLLALGLASAMAITRRAPQRLLGNFFAGRGIIAWRSMWIAAALLAVLIGVIAALADGYHIFGTDQIGQDVLYKTLKSIRTGVLIGTLTTLVILPFALLLGPMAGYFRGWVDDAIQYVYTTLSSIPGVLLIVAAVLMLQVYMQNHPQMFDTAAERADVRLLFLCIILGITSWSNLCRILRAETLKLSQMEYVQAATGLGVGRFRILGRHLLPNLMHLVLIQVVLDFSALVLAEAVLSYIGVGVDPSTFSWGNMINSARLELARDPIVWWPLTAAFLFMLALVLSANLFSDAVRDAFDPRLRRGFALGTP